MKTLLWPPKSYRRAIVWTDERPAMPRLPIERAEATFGVRGRVLATSHEAAVEILVPVGPMAQYALVGGVFEERMGEMLELRIDLTTDERAAPFPSEIALTTDAPFCGIPREYLRGITEGVGLSVREVEFPGGLLHVNVGAHGLVGSSIVTFRRATRMLMRVIASGLDDERLWIE